MRSVARHGGDLSTMVDTLTLTNRSPRRRACGKSAACPAQMIGADHFRSGAQYATTLRCPALHGTYMRF